MNGFVGEGTSGATACTLFLREAWYCPSPFPVGFSLVIMDLFTVAVTGPDVAAACRRFPGGPGASHRGLHLLYRVTQLLPYVVATGRWPAGLARVYIRCCLSRPHLFFPWPFLLGLPGRGACPVLPSIILPHLGPPLASRRDYRGCLYPLSPVVRLFHHLAFAFFCVCRCVCSADFSCFSVVVLG